MDTTRPSSFAFTLWRPAIRRDTPNPKDSCGTLPSYHTASGILGIPRFWRFLKSTALDELVYRSPHGRRPLEAPKARPAPPVFSDLGSSGSNHLELTIKDDQGATATTQRFVTVAAPTRPSLPNPPPETGESLYIADSVYGFKDPDFLLLALSATTMEAAMGVVRLAHEMGTCTLLTEGTRVVDIDSLVYPPWVLVKVRVLSTGEEYWVPAELVGAQEE